MVGANSVVNLTCGEDYKTDTFVGIAQTVQIECRLSGGSDITTTVHKDGVEIGGLTGTTVKFGPFPIPTDNIFGTYTFRALNNCSEDIQVTKILRQG